MIEVGDPVPLTLTITDPVTPFGPLDAGNVVLEVTDPAGLVTTLTGITTPAITHIVLSGIYRVTWTAALVGIHTFRWIATGVNPGVYPDVFQVEENAGAFISTAETLAHLRAQATITRAPDVEELRRLIRVACDAVERDLDRVIAPRTITETFDGGGTAIVLRSPVISITSVTDGTVGSLDPTGYTLDRQIGILYRGGQYAPTRFGCGRQSVAVTYRVGDPSPPWIAKQVALRGVARMWQFSQQMPHPGLDDIGADGNLFVPAGVLTPLELGAYNKLRHLALA